jgi:putative endonuclease
MPKPGFVYILASGRNGTLYVGVTADLVRRIHQHRNEHGGGFSRRYGTARLVHFEVFAGIREAIEREKQLKRWRRAWKVRLVEERNPYWRDLYPEIVPGAEPWNDAGSPPARG